MKVLEIEEASSHNALSFQPALLRLKESSGKDERLYGGDIPPTNDVDAEVDVNIDQDRRKSVRFLFAMRKSFISSVMLDHRHFLLALVLAPTLALLPVVVVCGEEEAVLGLFN